MQFVFALQKASVAAVNIAISSVGGGCCLDEDEEGEGDEEREVEVEVEDVKRKTRIGVRIIGENLPKVIRGK